MDVYLCGRYISKPPTVGGTTQAKEEEAAAATEGLGGATLQYGAANHGPGTRVGARMMMANDTVDIALVNLLSSEILTST